MDNPKHPPLSSPHAAAASATTKPGRKHIHHSPFFWVAAFCMLVAMTIFVLSLNFASPESAKEVPAIVP